MRGLDSLALIRTARTHSFQYIRLIRFECQDHLSVAKVPMDAHCFWADPVIKVAGAV